MPRTDSPKGRTNKPVAISMPPGLKERIDEAAAEDGRNRSSWIVRAIEAALGKGRKK